MTDRLELADDLAVALANEPCGLPCDELAPRVRRRRKDVLDALRSDPRFERRGRTRGSRWQLVSAGRPRAWDGMGRNPAAGPDRSVAPTNGRQLDVYDVLALIANESPAP
jgi:hypothetical protein